jgi:ribose 5-phosphate isomerase B
MKIAIGFDHAGFALKKELMDQLIEDGHKLVDLGTYSDAATDYPDYAFKVSRAVAAGRCDRGILICGSGIGMAIAANKVKGIRAATPWSVKTAKLVAQHNWCNVLCLSARLMSSRAILKMVRAWISTPFDRGGRHERRISKISKIEAKQ